ncbi:MAG: hypothetical protein IT384_32980 [Deltaproteobacteria bacterium]|nr:hypothetical protein [Deltaproteobacteria bacterium]
MHRTNLSSHSLLTLALAGILAILWVAPLWAAAPPPAPGAGEEASDPDEPDAPPPPEPSEPTPKDTSAPPPPAPSPPGAPDAAGEAPPVSPTPLEPVHPGSPEISWTLLGARVPSGSLLQGELGFSGLPRIAFHRWLGDGFSLGGLVAFDYGSFVPRAAFRSSLLLAVPIRYAIPLDAPFELAIRVDPGVVIPFDGGAGILIDAQVNLSWVLADRFVVGAGIDMPILIGIGDVLGGFAWPLLIGAIFEYHPLAPLALTLDAKLGPYLDTNAGALLGLRVLGGAAYRF